MQKKDLELAYLAIKNNIVKKIYIISLFILVAWFFLFYLNVNKEISKKTKLLKEVSEKQALTEKLISERLKIEKNIEDIKADIEKDLKKDPKKAILRLAKESNISLNSYKLIGESVKDKNNINQDTVNYEFHGKMDQITVFCNKINSCRDCLDCQEIQISKTNQDDDFKIACTFKTYTKTRN